MKLLGVCTTACNGAVTAVGKLITSTPLKRVLATRSAYFSSLLQSLAGLAITLSALIIIPGLVHASDVLSVREVIDKSLSSAYALKAYRASLSAAESRIDQADKKPNPRLNLSVEDLTGSGAFSELGRTELSLSYQQKLERGGKRYARRALAEQNKNLQSLKQQDIVLRMVYELEFEFIQIQALQARHAAFIKQRQFADDLKTIIEQRRMRGKDSDVDVDNAEIRLLKTESQVLQIERELQTAKKALSQRWQSEFTSGVDDYQLQQNTFSNDSLLPPAWTDVALQHPNVLRWQIEQERAQASMALAQARSKQDPTVSAGLRYLQESKDVALIFGVSMPLALHNQNRGNIQAAAADKEAAYWWQQDQILALKRDYERANAMATQSSTLAKQLKDDLLKRAQDAYEKVLERRRLGAASNLEVYAAQTLMSELQLQLIDTQEQFHKALAKARYTTAEYRFIFPHWFAKLTQADPEEEL